MSIDNKWTVSSEHLVQRNPQIRYRIVRETHRLPLPFPAQPEPTPEEVSQAFIGSLAGALFGDLTPRNLRHLLATTHQELVDIESQRESQDAARRLGDTTVAKVPVSFDTEVRMYLATERAPLEDLPGLLEADLAEPDIDAPLRRFASTLVGALGPHMSEAAWEHVVAAVQGELDQARAERVAASQKMMRATVRN